MLCLRERFQSGYDTQGGEGDFEIDTSPDGKPVLFLQCWFEVVPGAVTFYGMRSSV